MGGHETYAPFFDLDMGKYIDAEKLAKAIEDKGLNCSFALKIERLDTLALIDELQQEQQEVNLEKFISDFIDKKDSENQGKWCEEDIIEAMKSSFALGLNARKEETK